MGKTPPNNKKQRWTLLWRRDTRGKEGSPGPLVEPHERLDYTSSGELLPAEARVIYAHEAVPSPLHPQIHPVPRHMSKANPYAMSHAFSPASTAPSISQGVTRVSTDMGSTQYATTFASSESSLSTHVKQVLNLTSESVSDSNSSLSFFPNDDDPTSYYAGFPDASVQDASILNESISSSSSNLSDTITPASVKKIFYQLDQPDKRMASNSKGTFGPRVNQSGTKVQVLNPLLFQQPFPTANSVVPTNVTRSNDTEAVKHKTHSSSDSAIQLQSRQSGSFETRKQRPHGEGEQGPDLLYDLARHASVMYNEHLRMMKSQQKTNHTDVGHYSDQDYDPDRVYDVLTGLISSVEAMRAQHTAMLEQQRFFVSIMNHHLEILQTQKDFLQESQIQEQFRRDRLPSSSQETVTGPPVKKSWFAKRGRKESTGSQMGIYDANDARVKSERNARRTTWAAFDYNEQQQHQRTSLPRSWPLSRRTSAPGNLVPPPSTSSRQENRFSTRTRDGFFSRIISWKRSSS